MGRAVLERLSPLGAAYAAAIAIAAVLVLGPGGSSGLVVALLVVAYAALVIAVSATAEPGLSRPHVVGLGAGLLALAVVRPPSASHDVWSYAMYGRIAAVHHLSPYLHPPKQFPLDPILRRVDPLWRGTRSVYGPLFGAWSSLIAGRVGDSALLLRLAFQLTAAAAVGASAFLVDRRSGGDARGLALVLLNPLVVCSLVNDAHIDAVVGLAILGAALLLERKRDAWAGGLIGAAVLVKAIALVPAGGLGLWLLLRGRSRRAIHFGLALSLVVVGGYAVSGGRDALAPLGAASVHVTRASVWGPAREHLVEARVDDGTSQARATRSVGRLLGRAATLLVVVVAVGLVIGGTSRAGPTVVAGGAAVAYMLVGAYVLPWYAAAGLFCLALAPDWPLTWILVLHAGLLQLTEVPGHHFIAPLVRVLPARDVLHIRFERFLLPPIELALLIAAMVVARHRPGSDEHPTV